MAENANQQYEKIDTLKKVFVGGLAPSVTDEDLRNHFGEFGTLEEACVVRDSEKNSRKYAFLTFSNLAETQACLDVKSHVICEKEVEVRRSVPKDDLPDMREGQRSGELKCYMRFKTKDCDDITEDTIKDHFENHTMFGKKPIAVDILKSKESGKPTGSVFVRFEEDDDVTKAVSIKEFEINGKKASCGIARPKQRRGGMGGPFRGGPGGPGGSRGGRGRGGRGGGRRGGYGGGGGFGGDYNSNGYGYDNYGGYDSYNYDDGYGGNGYGGGYGGGGYDNYGGGSGSYSGGGGGGYGPPRQQRSGNRYRPY